MSKKEINKKSKKDILNPIDHKLLLSIEHRFKGGELDRNKETEDGWLDCSCGCYFFLKLEGDLGRDWGVCVNKESPRCGLLTFEHRGCDKFCSKNRD